MTFILILHARSGGFLNLTEAVGLIEEAELLMNGMEYLVPSVNILKLAEESQSSAYDCEFVALAKQFDLELVTSDTLIIQKFPDTAVHMSKFIKTNGSHA